MVQRIMRLRRGTTTVLKKGAIAMAGLRETLTGLAQLRRRFDRLMQSAAQRPPMAVGPSHTACRLGEVTGFGSNPGALRMLAYTPKNLPHGSALVVALHGCTQTAAAYDHGSGWSTLSDRFGFALLFPEQQHANNPNSCFTWFHPADTQRNRGEALSIRQMIAHMVRDHAIDQGRVFIVGLSAGGAMTAAMLAAYPEVFAGGATIAGLPYGCALTMQAAFEAMAQGSEHSSEQLGDLIRRASPHRGPWPKLSIWHGSADAIVNPRNAEQLVKQWTNVHGLPTEPDLVHRTRGHSRRVWHDEEGNDVIEANIISGMGHGVPLAHGADHRAHAGAFHFDVGVSSSLEIAKFWGIANDRPAKSDAAMRAAATGTHLSVPERAEVSGITVAAGRAPVAEPIAQRFWRSAGTEEECVGARGSRLDARDIVTAVLQKAGVLIPPGSKPTGDPRSIISHTLRSVGLVKER
jgi:poly(hydroxyalkanoate) depolymerase family esterase